MGGWPSLSFLNHGSQHTPGGCPILVAVLWRQGGALPMNPDAQWQAHPFAPPRRPFRFDLNDPFQPVGVMAEAAPRPILRFVYQSALHGVSVHVGQLLHALLLRPYVEVVVARLPKRSSAGGTEFAPRNLLQHL